MNFDRAAAEELVASAEASTLSKIFMKIKKQKLFSRLLEQPEKILMDSAFFEKKIYKFSWDKMGLSPLLVQPVFKCRKRTFFRNFLTTCGIALILLIPILASAQPPQLPHMFYGTINIDGGPAPAGTVIIAKTGNVERGRITVAISGQYGGSGLYEQKLLAQGDMQPGAVISFQTGNLTANQTASFSSGDISNLNLTFTTPSQAVQSGGSGGGGGSRGGGGGGSGGGGGGFTPSNLTTPTNPTISQSGNKKGDMNGDGKIDLFDFNALMINWGKQGFNIAVDLNGDGKVDVLDFNLLMVNWGK